MSPRSTRYGFPAMATTRSSSSTVATMHLKLGPDVQEMTDQEILERFNGEGQNADQ